ncbi:MAG: CusA/CzcA family heavy metal efflux RND transporter, partial [Chitinophagaceae bacterium]|nr:CusA/CzcA family heavy metal efflux RND transporter [Chitinophagaceae bacterium]
YNREAIARYGATIADVNRSVQAAYAGSVAGQIFENDRRFDLVIRLNESQRNNVDELGDLLVELPSGQQVPLNVLARVAIEEGPYQIQREDAQRRITIGFNVRGRDVQSIVEELQTKVKKQVQLPAGYYVTYGGQFENLQQATKRLAIAVPAALLLIFVMLFFAFRKFKYCLLIFSAIPLSAIGGVFALWIRDMPFSISAGIGFIALFGVAVLNGIVLITEMNRLKAEDNSSSISEVIAQATETRLRPVLMTAAVASLGFLPMALSNGAGAEVQRPLATVVIGGLLSATLLTLFVLPSLYLLFEKKKIQIPMKPLLIIVMMLSTWSLQAQPIKLEKLLALVKEKSPILKVGQLQEKYYTALKGTARDIPKTQLITELGNYNSFNFDSRVSILQPFSAGMVYRKQELVLNSYLHTAEANTIIQQQVLEKMIRQLYLELQYLMARKKILERADSVYESFQRVAQLRFEKGESNLLEKTTLDNQVMQNRQMLLMNVSDTKAIQLEISLLLQDSISIVPAEELVTAQQLYDTALLQQHPELQYYKAQEQQAEAETQLAKAKLKPEWLIGYNNQSLMGWMEYKNRSERFFTAGDRFSSVTLGMSIPFFNKAQKAKVEAANVQEQVNRANTDITALRLKTQLQQALQHRDKFNSSMTYFKNSALPQSNIIIQTANLNYKNGQISYIEWATLVNQALGIQMQYADTQRDHQLNEIQLDYLLQKN